ncbi:Na+/H+ antiporter subunit G [Nitrosomonas aestuarii]|uniref:Na+/H+ antiporter subunit G n=1 Tax=Nitrosomonas aestuarii TaxID=52441 RepID=UPI000D319E95|nr:multicomponent K+:H+ antiporter subunit G [Nitrosomonas aestuarii]
MLEFFLSFLILTGAIFTFIGSLGLVRLKDMYTRLHGPTKATTLGVGSLLIASAIYFSAQGPSISLHEFLITIFLLITAPVSAHLLAKTALHLNLTSLAEKPEKDAIDQGGPDEVDTAEETEKADTTDTAVKPEAAEALQAPDQTKS